MKSTRPILGFESFKWSTSKILHTLKWPTIQHLISSESLKFLHRPIFENFPKAITQLFNISLERSELARSTRIPRMIINSNSEYLTNSIIYRTLYMY